MKSFKQFCEDCSCEKKEKKGKNKPEVEIMPTMKDGIRDKSQKANYK